MSERKSEAGPGAAKAATSAGDERAERLAARLRDNLKRRKAQARGRRDTGDPAGVQDASRAPEPGEKDTKRT